MCVLRNTAKAAQLTWSMWVTPVQLSTAGELWNTFTIPYYQVCLRATAGLHLKYHIKKTVFMAPHKTVDLRTPNDIVRPLNKSITAHVLTCHSKITGVNDKWTNGWIPRCCLSFRVLAGSLSWCNRYTGVKQSHCLRHVCFSLPNKSKISTGNRPMH